MKLLAAASPLTSCSRRAFGPVPWRWRIAIVEPSSSLATWRLGFSAIRCRVCRRSIGEDTMNKPTKIKYWDSRPKKENPSRCRGQRRGALITEVSARESVFWHDLATSANWQRKEPCGETTGGGVCGGSFPRHWVHRRRSGTIVAECRLWARTHQASKRSLAK